MSKRLLAVLALSSALALTACGGNSDTASDTSTTSSSPAAGSSDDGSGPCQYPTDGTKPAKKVTPPPSTPTVSGTVAATMDTSVGTFALSLDATAAPCTVNSFVSLAQQGYFDNTTCHRLVTSGIFVLQCGDPTGTGTGTPGYSFADELTGTETYPSGTLAMANAGPNTNGSQFFIVYGSTQLSPDYTVFGTVDAKTVAEVQKVAQAGTDNSNGQDDGKPNTPVDIMSVKVG